MPEVVVYTTRFCPYCVRAKALLKRNGITDFTEIPVAGSDQKRQEMIRLSGRHTVPQVFIGDTHVGGYDDMIALHRAGGLEPLLESAA